MEKIPSLVLVSAVALISPQGGLVLMQRRPGPAQHGGLWEFPGGKLDPGEAPEQAAVRELSEELAVNLDRATLSPVGFASGATAIAGQGIVILLFAATQWEGDPQCLAASELGWFKVTALAELDMPPLDYTLADALGRWERERQP